MMCARIGMVTGAGLAGALRKRFPKPVLVAVAIALLVANTVNIAADLLGMADAAEMLTGINSHLLVVLFGVAISVAIVRLRYYQLANALKWLALVLGAYVITAFLVHPHWSAVLHDAVIPSLPVGKEAWATLVAILGTTISPYLFFWQASQEVEEMQRGRPSPPLKSLARGGKVELDRMALDTSVGMVLSNVIAYFIILTTAATLNAHGVTDIHTAADAANALRPLAGDLTFFLFALGIIGTGLLAVPVLAGSAAYAISDAWGWRATLEARPRDAMGFYGLIAGATLIGLGLTLAHIDPIHMLIWSAVLNGIVAVPVMAVMMVVSSNAAVMKTFRVRGSLLLVGWLATGVMAVAAAAFLWSLV
jgi:Mn2+/Fe2+ NRAMP family transporter